MSPRASAFVALAAILIVGFFRIWASLGRHFRERGEVENFVLLFNRYTKSEGDDLDAYGQLIERSYRIQNLLGPVGVMAFFRAPFGKFTAHDWLIILNGLPELHRDWGHGRGRRSDYTQLLAETLVRYMGLSQDLIREKQRDLRNPLVWLREGVSAILLLPVQTLQALGIGSESRTAAVARSRAFRVIAALVAVIGLIGSIFTIVLGWGAMMDLLRRVLGP